MGAKDQLMKQCVQEKGGAAKARRRLMAGIAAMLLVIAMAAAPSHGQSSRTEASERPD